MTDEVDSKLPKELAAAFKQYNEEDCPGDLNDYLDGRDVLHEAFVRHEAEPTEDVVGDCGPGYYGTWVRAKDGHWWSTCVPYPA
jgi:hypothetical protein